MDYLQWKTQMRSEYFSRNVLAGYINRWKNITADGLFRKNATTTIWIWKHWNNLMVNNCSKRNSNWKIDMIEWLELKSKFQWKRNIHLASTDIVKWRKNEWLWKFWKRNYLYENFEKRGGSREKGEEETKSIPHAPVIISAVFTLFGT